MTYNWNQPGSLGWNREQPEESSPFPLPVFPPLLLKIKQPAVTLGGEAFVWICAAADEIPRWSGGLYDFHPHE